MLLLTSLIMTIETVINVLIVFYGFLCWIGGMITLFQVSLWIPVSFLGIFLLLPKPPEDEDYTPLTTRDFFLSNVAIFLPILVEIVWPITRVSLNGTIQ